MIADESEGPIETAFKMMTAPVWVPIYFAYVGCRKLAEAWSRRKAKPVEQVEVLEPMRTMPTREIERAVYAALILAGEPVNNRRLAELMGCVTTSRLTPGCPARGDDPQGPQGSRGDAELELN